jgi:Tol biopolymer transport system component
MIGQRLGPYEITAKLGEGGMGQVFQAKDFQLGRNVALKVLPEGFTQDPERLQRFEREAKLLAQLNHPNIAQIYGFETSGDTRALVMELVDGPTLAERLELGPLPLDECLSVSLQIARALEEAHEKGIVHRDLKPQNIKASRDGKVKVLDFGLAKAMDPVGSASGGATSASQLAQSPTMTLGGTAMGVILGTAAYMAPEQAKGLPVDKRADVWSFGVVLFEMLTGKRLFVGDSVPETLAGVLRNEIDFSALPAKTPPEVRRLLERCLERNPRDRLRDIGEARFALEHPAALSSFPAAAATRRVGWRWLAAVGVLGVIMGFGLAALARRPAESSAGAPELTLQPITASGNVISASISPDGAYVAYVESEQGSQSLWLQQLATGQTLRLIPEEPIQYWHHTFSRDGSSIYFGRRSESEPRGALYSISTLGGGPRRLLGDIDSAVTFSPDGREIAFTRARHPTEAASALVVAKADGSQERVLASFRLPEQVAGIFFAAPAWSPDGRRIALPVVAQSSEGSDGRTRLATVDVSDGAVATLADPGWLFAAQSAWLPDGRSLVAIARAVDQPRPQLWSVDYPSGKARRITSDLDERRIVSLSADGTKLVTVAAAYLSNVWSMPLAGGTPPRRLSRTNGDGGFGLGFARGGEVVYVESSGRTLAFWSARPDGTDRRPRFAFAGQSVAGLASNTRDGTVVGAGIVGYPTIGHDGTLYYLARTRTVTELRAATSDGASSRTILRDVQFAPFDLAPDGRHLLVGTLVGGEGRIERVAVDGSSRETLVEAPSSSPAFHPSGTRFAYIARDADSRARLVVRALAGGPPLVDLPLGLAQRSGVRLALRDEGFYVNSLVGDESNVWLVPARGGEPKRMTAFEDQTLYDFAISPDGATLAVSRGPRLRDAQLITGFAGARGASAP